MRSQKLQFEPLRDDLEGDDVAYYLDDIDAEKALGGVPGCNCFDCQAIRARIVADRTPHEMRGGPMVTLGNSQNLFTHPLADPNRVYGINESRIADVIHNARRNTRYDGRFM